MLKIDVPGWRIDEILGRSKRNIVYAAYEVTPPHRKGVIKFFCAEDKNQAQADFSSEKMVLESQLTVDCLPVLYGEGISEGIHYLIAERFESLPVKLSITRFIQIALDLLDNVYALDQAHIYHNDIKPNNIGIKNGRARLFDFDAATCLNERREFHFHNGTGHYMAPEVRKDGNVTLLSEFYSLGVTLRELCPKDGEYIFDKILSRATATTVSQRPQTISEFRSEILKAVPEFKRKVAKDSRLKKVAILISAVVSGSVLLGLFFGGVAFADFKQEQNKAAVKLGQSTIQHDYIRSGLHYYQQGNLIEAYLHLRMGRLQQYYHPSNYIGINVEAIYEDCFERVRDKTTH